MREELPEYRIYWSDGDTVHVARDIIGNEMLLASLAVERQLYPNSILYVREVLETVRQIIHPTDPLPPMGEIGR